MKIDTTKAKTKTQELFTHAEPGGVVFSEDTPIPALRITCRVCGMTDKGNQDAILLCRYCLEDPERTRAGLHVRRDAIFVRMARAETAWALALTEDKKVQGWWEQVWDKPALHEKALLAGGRGAALVRAWRAFSEEYDACALEKDRIHDGEREITQALLNLTEVF